AGLLHAEHQSELPEDVRYRVHRHRKLIDPQPNSTPGSSPPGMRDTVDAGRAADADAGRLADAEEELIAEPWTLSALAALLDRLEREAPVQAAALRLATPDRDGCVSRQQGLSVGSVFR